MFKKWFDQHFLLVQFMLVSFLQSNFFVTIFLGKASMILAPIKQFWLLATIMVTIFFSGELL